jgi:YD repeat-containing protein
MRQVTKLAMLLILLHPVWAQQNNGPINYYYDSLGRLIRIVDGNGNVASYNYDAVGNILSISRSTVSGLNIFNFTPGQGSAGQNVTIQGQGFSTTPSSNIVQFNGIAATVTAASATSLTVTVPVGATTGPISVQVGTATATSNTNFTIVPATIVSLQVTPGSSSLILGVVSQVTVQLAAIATYNNGIQQDVTASTTFTSSNSSVALMIGQGLFQRSSPGVATITATYNAFIGYAYIKVLDLTSISITPQSPTIPFGTTLQFTALGRFSDGSSQDVTSATSWSSDQSAIATIGNATGSQGLADGISVGSVAITAVCAGNSASTTLAVTQGTPSSLVVSPGTVSIPKAVQQTFTAAGVFPDGSIRTETTAVTWSSSNPAVATISNSPGSQGTATDVGVGTTTIMAALGALTGSASLTLTPAVPASVSVTPATAALQPGKTAQLSATLTLSDGTTQNITQTATWTSSATGVATVSNAAGSQGLVTAVAVGSAAVTATSGSLSGSATIFVNNSSVASYPRFLYVSSGGGGIFTYSVNSQTGQLRSDGSVQVSNQGGNLAIDPSQNYVFISVPAVGGNFFAFAVNPSNGSLTPVPGSPYTAGTSIGPVAAESSGRFVYVGDPTSNSIFGYSIGSNGALTTLPGSPYAISGPPNVLLAHPSGKYLFATVNAQNAVGSVTVFAIDANTGALTVIPGSPFATAYSTVALAQDPAGQFLFASNTGQNFGSWLSPLRAPEDLEASATSPKLSRDALNTTAFPDAPLHPAPRTRPVGVLLADLDLDTTGLVGHRENTDRDWSFAPMFTGWPQSNGVTTSPAISAFTVDPSTGTLTEVSGSPFVISSSLQSISVDTTGQYLYGPGYPAVLGFGIGGTGALTLLANSPFAVGASGKIVFDPSGHFAYTPGGNGIQELGTDSSAGTLSDLPGGAPVGGSSLAISSGSAPITYVPQFAYVMSAGGTGANDISGYSIDPVLGALTPMSGSPFAEGYSPVAATIDPSGLSLYVANTCSDPTCTQANGSVSGYTIDPNLGGLTAAFGSPFAAGVSPVSISLQAPGPYAQGSTEYAYVPSQNGQVYEYSVTPSTGVLTAFATSPAGIGLSGVIATAVDPTGSFLYVISKCSTCTTGTFSVFDLFLYNGQLIYEPPFLSAPIGANPTSIAVDPGGRFVLITDGASNTVWSFATATNWTQIAGSPFATDGNPSAVALDPAGQYVYVANQSTNDVSAYTMNPSTGTLTAIPGSPYPVGAGPVSLNVDFSGQFLYVTNNSSGTISAFAITAGTGALTPLSGSPFATGAAPISIQTTGKIQ